MVAQFNLAEKDPACWGSGMRLLLENQPLLNKHMHEHYILIKSTIPQNIACNEEAVQMALTWVYQHSNSVRFYCDDGAVHLHEYDWILLVSWYPHSCEWATDCEECMRQLMPINTDTSLQYKPELLLCFISSYWKQVLWIHKRFLCSCIRSCSCCLCQRKCIKG